MSNRTGKEEVDEYNSEDENNVEQVLSEDELNEEVKEDKKLPVKGKVEKVYPKIETNVKGKKSKTDETCREVTDNDLFVGCCSRLKFNPKYTKICHPKRTKDGKYEMNRWINIKRKKKDLVGEKRVKFQSRVDNDYFKRLCARHLCLGMGGVMSQQTMDALVSKISKNAENPKFIVCEGGIKEVKHNLPCGLALKITGVESADVADIHSNGDSNVTSCEVDGVYVPEKTGDFSRVLNKNFDDAKSQNETRILRNLTPDKIDKFLRDHSAAGCFILTCNSGVYDYLLSEGKRYQTSSEQLKPDDNGEVRLQYNTGKMLREDLLKKVAEFKTHNTVNFTVNSHSNKKDWSCLNETANKTLKTQTNSYKQRHSSVIDDDKVFHFQCCLTLMLKFVN